MCKLNKKKATRVLTMGRDPERCDKERWTAGVAFSSKGLQGGLQESSLTSRTKKGLGG